MFKIGEFSKLSYVRIRMLRHYDKLELVIPNPIDERSGFHYYSAQPLEKVNKIQKLKSLGFSLAIIKEILDKKDMLDVSTFFDIRQRELQEELEKMSLQAKQLHSVK